MPAKKTATTPKQRTGCFFCSVAAPQLESMIENLWPESTREHFRSSRVEFLKGIRGMLDQRIAQLSEQPKRGTRVAVE